MAILQGEAAAQWLKNNPTAAYNTLDSANRADIQSNYRGDNGLIGNIIGGITAPISDYWLGGAEQINQALNRAGGNKDYKPQILSKNEWDEYVKNPLGKNIQNIVGASSFTIPAGSGAGLLKTIAKGALSGGAYSFGQGDMRDPNQLLGDTAKGALIGGGTAGLLGLASKGYSKLFGKGTAQTAETGAQVADKTKAGETGLVGKLGKNLEERGQNLSYKDIGFKLGDKPGAFSDLAQSQQLIDQKLSQYGLSRSPKNIVDKLPELVGKERLAELSKTPISVSTDNIAKDLASTVMNRTSKDITADQAKSLVQNVLDKFGSEAKGVTKITTSGGEKVLQANLGTTLDQFQMQDAISKLGDSFMKYTSNPAGVTPEIAAQASVYESLRNMLGTQVPGYNDANSVFSTVFDQVGNITKKANAGFGTDKLGQVSTTNLTKQGISKVIGPTMEKTGQLLQKLGGGSGDVGAVSGGITGGTGGLVKASGNQWNKALETITKTMPASAQTGAIQQLANQLPAAAASDPVAKQMMTTIKSIYGISPQVLGTNTNEYGLTPGESVDGGLGYAAPAGIQAQYNPQTGQMEVAPESKAQLAAFEQSMGKPGQQAGNMFQTNPTQATLMLLQGGYSPAEVKQIQSLFAPAEDTAKPLSAKERQSAANINTGLGALSDIRSIIQEDNMALLGSQLPGFLQSSKAKQLGTALKQVTDVIGRLRSGGVINKDEMDTFKSFLPVPTDDSQTIDYKLAQIEGLLNNANPDQAGTMKSSNQSDPSALLAMLMGGQ